MRIQLLDIDRPWFDDDTLVVMRVGVEVGPDGIPYDAYDHYTILLNHMQVGWVEQDLAGTWHGCLPGDGTSVCAHYDAHNAAVAVCDEAWQRMQASDAAAAAEYEASKEN